MDLESAFGIRTIEDMTNNKVFKLAQALVVMTACKK